MGDRERRFFSSLISSAPRKVPLKEDEGSARGPAEAIDRLVGVADRKDVALLSRQLLQDLDLGEIDVLKLIHQDEASARAAGQFALLLQQMVGVGDHVAEGAELVFSQHAFHGGEHACDFAATPDDFFVRQGGQRLSICSPVEPATRRVRVFCTYSSYFSGLTSSS